MPTYTVKLLKKEEIANETMAFHFEKPEGLAFSAGQFGGFTLIDPPETDEEGNRRLFSFANAPFEQDLMIAARMRDTAFKRVLKSLAIGTKVKLDSPYGNFVLHKTSVTPAVFLTGGVGITPARSIIAQATYERLPHRIILFYSNKTQRDTGFMSDFESYAKGNTNFTFVPVMTRTTSQEWKGESGHITREMLLKYVKGLSAPNYYLSGPAGMVAAMRQALSDMAVNEENIRTEQFSGY
jgi:ferredoxin-NADP reductase